MDGPQVDETTNPLIIFGRLWREEVMQPCLSICQSRPPSIIACCVAWSEPEEKLSNYIHRSNCVTALVPHSSVTDAAAAKGEAEFPHILPLYIFPS